MMTKLELTKEEARFAADTLKAFAARCRRPWNPERTKTYEALASELGIPSDGCIVWLDDRQAGCLAFAVINADQADPLCKRLTIKLQLKNVLPAEALTLDDMNCMHGHPVFSKNLSCYGLIDVNQESRTHEDAPYLKCLTGDYDIIERGLLCFRCTISRS